MKILGIFTNDASNMDFIIHHTLETVKLWAPNYLIFAEFSNGIRHLPSKCLLMMKKMWWFISSTLQGEKKLSKKIAFSSSDNWAHKHWVISSHFSMPLAFPSPNFIIFHFSNLFFLAQICLSSNEKKESQYKTEFVILRTACEAFTWRRKWANGAHIKNVMTITSHKLSTDMEFENCRWHRKSSENAQTLKRRGFHFIVSYYSELYCMLNIKCTQITFHECFSIEQPKIVNTKTKKK